MIRTDLFKLFLRLEWLLRHRRIFARVHAARPKLLVDVSVIIRSDAQTGIQRVVRAVWSQLVNQHSKDFDVVPVFATHSAGYRVAPADFLENRPAMPEGPVAVAGKGDKFLGLDLSAQYLPSYVQQVRQWRQAGATVHLVVYDLLPMQHPEWFREIAVKRFRQWFRFLLAEADQAICISRQVARDVRIEVGKSKRRKEIEVAVIPMGSDIGASRPSTGISKGTLSLAEGLRFRRAVLMVGTVEPRKGHEVALAAFEQLWATGRDSPDLVIVGKPGWKTEELQHLLRTHPQAGRRLHWLVQASDEELCQLYAACSGVLMTSYGEGFGLPIAEAVALGTPVLARDLPVFTEQNLPGVSYFDDDRPGPLAAKIVELLEQGQARQSAPVSPHSWSDSVNSLLACLQLHGTEVANPPGNLHAS